MLVALRQLKAHDRHPMREAQKKALSTYITLRTLSGPRSVGIFPGKAFNNLE